MKRALATLAVIGLAVPAFADVFPGYLVQEYGASKDTFIVVEDPPPNSNFGRAGSWRGYKYHQFSYLADWSEADKQDLWAEYQALVGGGAVYGVDFDVRVCLGAELSGSSPVDRITVEARRSTTGWVEGTGTRSVPTNDGASELTRDGTNPWTNASGTAYNAFWDWGGNGNDFLNYNWDVSASPAEIAWNQFPLTQSQALDVLSDPLSMGINFANSNSNNAVLTNDQWGANGARLGVWIIPEPATMMLIGAGAVALVLRKRR